MMYLNWTNKMRYSGVIILLVWILFSCSSPEQEQQAEQVKPQETVRTDYPKTMQMIWNAHGGLEQWRNMKSLYFEIPGDPENERNYVQLKDRRDRIEGNNYTMGYDGDQVWLEADTTYKGNAEFYHNLNFYFFAMPFVLADDGINYSEIEPLEFDGKMYPGVGISYQEDVGTSPKDEYFIYYDPETSKMSWLGYTVTYFSGEKSSDVHWIRYTAWGDVSGLTLPTTLTWYEQEDGLPSTPKNDKNFINIKLDKQPFEDHLFIKS